MNKIIHRFQLTGFYCIVFLLTSGIANGQDTALNKYGLYIVETKDALQKMIRKNPNKEMVDLHKKIPGLILDLRYAGTNNFMQQVLYPVITTTYLRKPAADSLAVIQKILNQSGLGLKIYDAYRPYSVTEKMWEPVQDDRYAADPKKGSGHNRGVAVDLTIVNLKNNEVLDMGTGFDNFSDTAHHAFSNLPEEVLQNRLLLKNIMEQHGFKALDTEWWHYSLPNAKEFELMNIAFKDFAVKSIPKNKTNTHAKRSTH
ncbi:MAG: D-alanyl-D-alanine dipeptidase [Ferruginibacter sp.]